MVKRLNIKGFTLIELLVSISIVSIIMISIFVAINSNLKSNTKNDKDIKSLQIVQSEIENLRYQIKSSSGDRFKIIEYDENPGVDTTTEICINKNEQYEYEYLKKIYSKSNIYKVKLEITRSESNLYTIRVSVASKNDYFSKKNTNIVTKVFGRYNPEELK